MTYVRSELEVGFTSLDVLGLGLVQVTVDDLLGVGKRSVESEKNTK